MLFGSVGPICWCDLKIDCCHTIIPLRDWGHAWAQYWTPSHQGWSYLLHCSVLRLPSAQTNTEPSIWYQPAINGTMIHCTSTLEEAVIFSYCRENLLWICVCLPCPQCLYRYFHQMDNSMFDLPNDIPRDFASDQGTSFYERINMTASTKYCHAQCCVLSS